jgi:cell division protein FtsL
MANHHEPCECEELKQQLADCKDAKHKDCKEKTEQQSVKIAALEKKIMTLTIVGAVAVTVIGKEMADKVIDAFGTVEQVQEKISSPLGANNTNDKVTDNSSSNGGDPFRTTN